MKHITVFSKGRPVLAASTPECDKCYDRKEPLLGPGTAAMKCNRKKGCTFV